MEPVQSAPQSPPSTKVSAPVLPHDKVVMSEIVKQMDKLFPVSKQVLLAENEKLESDRKAWADETKTSPVDVKVPSRVRLDVGGKIFATSLDSLTHVKGSYFDHMFSGRWKLQRNAEDGTFFIDRDPEVFHYIMNYLRQEPIDLQSIKSKKIAALRKDAEFYGLPGLVELLKPAALEERWDQHGPYHEAFTQNNKVATHNNSSNHDWCIGKNKYSAEDHVRIKLKLISMGSWFMVGFIGKVPTTNNSYSDTTCYAFATGTLYQAGQSTSNSTLVFAQDDELALEIDCKKKQIRVKNITKGWSYEISN
ncbi:MAG TPA: BTB/POZ domain-containing protein, partial [Oculatellaceae cyanobacterium]